MEYNLKAAIFESGYKSMKEFSEKANIDRTALNKIIKGETVNAQGITIMKIANALNISYVEASELCSRKG